MAEAKQLIASFCAYRERCHSEVRSRLYDYGLFGDDVEELIAEMIQLGYLDETRFAKAFVRGKFLYNHWGRDKIRRALLAKQVSETCIELGMTELNESDYYQKLEKLAITRSASLRESNPFVKNQKVARYLIGKGFEHNLVWEVIRDLGEPNS